MDGQGNLERTWKVREFEKKNKAMAGSLQKIYSVQDGKGCIFLEIAHLPTHWGLL